MTMLLPTLVVATVMSAQSSLQFKLSDLPPLKRWEIPTYNHARKTVGRKFKDFDSIDVKRSHYWEAKPDFTAKEIDWYDDPETVKLDYNYKNFLDNPESALKEEVSASLVGKDSSNLLGGKRDKVVKKPTDDDFDAVDNAFVRSVITPRNNSTYINSTHKHSKKKRKHHRIVKKIRHRRSTEQSKYDEIFTENDDKIPAKTTDPLDIFDERYKRDVISDFLNKPREAGNKKTTVIAKEINKNRQATKKEEIEETGQSRKTAEQILKSKKITEGVLGDEHPVSKDTIADASRAQRKSQDVRATTRERIDHPKDKFNMDTVPSNVARAVAMAMEQLKRDKMWGKVFVHVRPSGQLKVMVQETRKMEEENKRKKK